MTLRHLGHYRACYGVFDCLRTMKPREVVEVFRAFWPLVAEDRNRDQSADRSRRRGRLGAACFIVIAAENESQVRKLCPHRLRDRLKIPGIKCYGNRMPGRLMNARAGRKALGHTHHRLGLADGEVAPVLAPTSQEPLIAGGGDELQ